MNITLKDVPESVHQRLKRRAERHGRSLNKEAVGILTEALEPKRHESKTLLETIRQRRDKMQPIVREAEIDQIINAGRR